MSLNERCKGFSRFWLKHNRTICLIATILTGLILLSPLLHFQFFLSPGDHGRDLYAFKKTMEGAFPYRDYSWLFGPLMPYYYSLFYWAGGVSIQSVLAGQFVLIFLTGLFVYLICVTFLPPAFSFLAAFWYWSYRGEEFFHTYNHIGGVLTLLIALFCIIRYIKQSKNVYVYAGFMSVFLFTLIRLNMGIATLLAYMSGLVLIDFVQKNAHAPRRWKLYASLSLAVIAATAGVYWFLLHGLPDFIVYQSFPYAKIQRTDHTPGVWATVRFTWSLLRSYFTATLAQSIFGFLLLGTIIQSCIFVFSRKTEEHLKTTYFLLFTSIFIFLALASHEFMVSGVPYRMMWFFPLIYILIFAFVSVGTKNISSSIIKGLIFVTLFLPPYWNSSFMARVYASYKIPPHNIRIGNNNIYTMQDPMWIKIVTDATAYLKANVPPDDTILVLPFDPLYLFLSERDSAAHQLVYFKHIIIPKEQELKTIREMEERNGNWAVISNRSNTSEWGTESFGIDYCPLLAKYLEDHFQEVAIFGDWTSPPGWAWNHGVKILKRVK